MDVAAELATLSRFIPADRAHAIATGRTLPERQRGVVLFADIGGFTPLAETHGEGARAPSTAPGSSPRGSTAPSGPWPRRSIATAAASSRSPATRSTCWFDDDHRLAAVAAALEMQAAMAAAPDAPAVADGYGRPSLKVSLAGGETRRFVVGDPEIQVFDVLSGAVVDLAGTGEKHCGPGEVTLDAATAVELAGVDHHHRGRSAASCT